MRPLLLTGPPAAGKSTTAQALARSLARAAVVDVDDVRQLVVAGHAAPWDGEEGRRQQRLGVENACDLAARLHAAGIEVVLADVADPGTLRRYRRRLPDLLVVKLRVSPPEARRRFHLRPVHLTEAERASLYAADAATDDLVDRVLDVSALDADEQAQAVRRLWAG